MSKDTKMQRYASKGATVRQMGFETSIHALPVEVKQEIDSLLNRKYSPLKILQELSKKYPSQSLPSKSALYNYRTRHFTKSLSNHRQLIHAESQLDEDKIKLKSVLLTQIKRFVAFDLPTLRDKWINALERDEHLQLQGTKEVGKLYMDAVKLGLETIPKLNINLSSDIDQETQQIEDEDKPEINWDKMLADTINRNWKQIQVRVERQKSMKQAIDV